MEQIRCGDLTSDRFKPIRGGSSGAASANAAVSFELEFGRMGYYAPRLCTVIPADSQQFADDRDGLFTDLKIKRLCRIPSDRASTCTFAVGTVEALAHRSQPVQRLLEIGMHWPNDTQTSMSYIAPSYRTARQMSSAEVDELVRAWEAGTGVVNLAAQFGVHRQTVGKHLHARGIDTTETLNSEQLAEATELYRAGWSLARLANRYGISDGTVRIRLLEVGVTMRKRRGGRKKAV